MTHPDYDKIYQIIKEHGPISLAEIGPYLHDKYVFKHNEVAGYLSNLSKNGLIKNIAGEKKRIKKTSSQKIWVAVEQ